MSPRTVSPPSTATPAARGAPFSLVRAPPPGRRHGSRPPARRRGAPERPLDDRPSDPEVDKVLVARLRVASKLRSDILHLCAGVHERRQARPARSSPARSVHAGGTRAAERSEGFPRRSSPNADIGSALRPAASRSRTMAWWPARATASAAASPATPPPATTNLTNANITGDPASGQPVGSSPGRPEGSQGTPHPGQMGPTRRGREVARLRGRDSNPDYLIQSQASYH